MKGLLPKFSFGLLAVLVLATILLTVGRRETYAQPSVTSYNPSGLHALQEVLHAQGIPTHVSRLQQPKLMQNDLVIAAYVEDDGMQARSTIEESLTAFVKAGGRVLVLPFDRDFRARSFTAIKAPVSIVNGITNETLKVNTAPLTYGSLFEFEENASTSTASFLEIASGVETFSPWEKNSAGSGEPFITTSLLGQGILARATDGLFATNRFIDRFDNAEVAVRTIQGLLPKGGRVVFAEAAQGGGIAPSLTTTLGEWAVGAWVQILFLFLVVVLTLGIRFGLPEMAWRKQTGQREMVDAISFVYQRAKASSVALDVAYQEADRRIRRGLKLPAHLSNSERDAKIPESLSKLLSTVDHLRKPLVQVDAKGRQTVTHRCTPQEALDNIRKLEAELDQFVPKTRNRIS